MALSLFLITSSMECRRAEPSSQNSSNLVCQLEQVLPFQLGQESKQWAVWSIFNQKINVSQNVRYYIIINYFISETCSKMDNLFTFNSQQFKFISIPSSLHSLRKKKTRLPPKTISSIQTESTNPIPYKNSKYKNKSRDVRRNVQFSAVPSDQLAKIQFSLYDNLQEDVRKRERFSQSNSRRYLLQLYNKRSLDLESQGGLNENIRNNTIISSAEAEDCLKKQRRQKSFRLAPKVLLPVSDRKLPKVFKQIGEENFLPPMKKLWLNKSIRESFSSQRARRLLNYEEQLQKMSKCGVMEDEKRSTIHL